MSNEQALIMRTLAGIEIEITSECITVNGIDHRFGSNARIDPKLVFPSLTGSFIIVQLEDVPILLTFAAQSLFSDEIVMRSSLISATFSLNEKYFFVLTGRNSICMFKTIDCEFIGESYFRCNFKPTIIEYIESYRFIKISSEDKNELILDVPPSVLCSHPIMPNTLHESNRDVKELFLTENQPLKKDLGLPKPGYPHSYPSSMNQAALDVYEKSKDASHRKYSINMRRNALLIKTKELQSQNTQLEHLQQQCDQRATDLLQRINLLIMRKENRADVKALEEQMENIDTKWMKTDKSLEIVDRGTALDLHQCRFYETLDQIEKVIGLL